MRKLRLIALAVLLLGAPLGLLVTAASASPGGASSSAVKLSAFPDGGALTPTDSIPVTRIVGGTATQYNAKISGATLGTILGATPLPVAQGGTGNTTLPLAMDALTVRSGTASGVLNVTPDGVYSVGAYNSDYRSCPIYAWGDSLTGGVVASTWPSILTATYGCQTYNFGIGGQLSKQIAQRAGGVSFTLTVSSNQLAVGSNSVTKINGNTPGGCNADCTDYPLSTGAGNGTYTLPGTLCTYHGLLTRVGSGGPPSTAETYTFTPDFTSGGPFACSANSTFTVDTVANSTVATIIWSGRNDYGANFASTAANIATQVATLTGPNYVVLGMFNSAAEPIGSNGYNNVIAINNTLKATYGSNFLDIRKIFYDSYNGSNGVDIAEHALGDMPYTLMATTTGTLSGGITNSATAFNVSGTAYTGAVVNIDSEYIKILAASGTSITSAARGYGGSTAASHTNGTVYSISDVIHPGTTGNTVIAKAITQYVKFLQFRALNNNSGNTPSFILPNDTSGDSFAVGNQSANLLIGNASYGNTIVGTKSLAQAISPLSVRNTTLGHKTLNVSNGGSDNVAIGYVADKLNVAGSFNVAIGSSAMELSATGNNQTIVGYYAGRNLTGSSNTAVGSFALTTATVASKNTAVGYGALTAVTSGANNTGLGYNAGAAITTGGNNVTLGSSSGSGITTGSSNTVLGYQVAQAGLTTGSNNILIGTSTLVSTVATGTSNELNIGNAIAGTIPLGTNPSVCSVGAMCRLGHITSADFNVTTDQAIVIYPLTTTNAGYLSSATKYIVTEIDVGNCSASLTTAKGGFYTATSKGGTIIGTTTTPFTNATSATTRQRLTGLTNEDTTVFTAATLYLSLTTAQGTAATCDVDVFGVPYN